MKERENEFISLCKYADQADIKAIVLVPLNDDSIHSVDKQTQLLEKSLSQKWFRKSKLFSNLFRFR